MIKLIVVVLCLVAASLSVSTEFDEWANFKAQHRKTYRSPREEQYRLGVYLSNKEMIEDHNAKYKAGVYSYELKMNHFGDKLPQEISALLNGFNRNGEVTRRRPGLTFNIPSVSKIPSSIDWREKGAVTPVKDQGNCGSCWAFSTTGSLEGQMFLKTGELVSLSEQNLIDCSVMNFGCNGGAMDLAFEYINSNGGLDREDSYPYEGMPRRCRYRSSDSAATVSSYVDIPQGDEEALKKAVATVGPISIAINTHPIKFSFYSRGVFKDNSCDPHNLNHAVLLVGYGSEKGRDYWLIKNSWNTYWGEEGYIRIARNQGNMCGVATNASYPIV